MRQFNHTNRRANPARRGIESIESEATAADAAINGWHTWD